MSVFSLEHTLTIFFSFCKTRLQSNQPELNTERVYVEKKDKFSYHGALLVLEFV